jgi:hypothetical protein
MILLDRQQTKENEHPLTTHNLLDRANRDCDQSSNMKLFTLALASLFSCVTAQNGTVHIVDPDTTPVEYMHNGTDLLGHLAVPDGEGKFPAIVIIP